MPTDVDAVYGGAYKAEDLPKGGLELTISGFTVKDFEGANKIVLFFEESGQSLVLNKTRKEAIKANLKKRNVRWKFAEDWVGQQIVIVPGKTNFKGDIVACIDIKEDSDMGKPASRARKNIPDDPSETDADIPF